MKKITKKILKVCGTPEDFCFDYINGASQEADIRRMKEYVACIRKVDKEQEGEKMKKIKAWMLVSHNIPIQIKERMGSIIPYILAIFPSKKAAMTEIKNWDTEDEIIPVEVMIRKLDAY